MFEEFKKFITRGNVIDLAVGIVIGAAFGAIVTSFVNDILMPPIGLLLGKVDFTNLYIVLKEGATAAPYASLAAAREAGAVTINYGVFINYLINFFIVAAAIFFLVVRPINKLHERKRVEEVPAAPPTKECPYCLSTIPLQASRCPHCTSQLMK